MKKPYFTRKNLIALSLSFFYAFLLVFVGFCIEGANKVVSKSNPFMKLNQLFNFKVIEAGLAGFITLILVALYIIVFVAVCIYERRYAVVNAKNPYSVKMVLSYVLSFFACVVLSFGVGIIFVKPFTFDNVITILTFVGQALLITTLIYVVLLLLIGGILLFVVNFLLVDKPFRFFEEKDMPIIEDEIEENVDVSANFDDVDFNTNGDTIAAAGGAGGFGGASGFATEGAAVNEARELDDREKVFPSLSKMDEEYEGYEIERIETDDYSLEEICVKFRNYLAKVEELYFDIETIRYFVSGFGASHFMILEGLSGTGKSSLPRYFAKFLNANLLFLPVQATWRDKTNLVGYFNDFAKNYTETEFLVGLYHGNYNPDMIHFYVLDEMNISRVEYYFADFLSVLEYPVPEWRLQIMNLPYNFLPPAKLQNGVIQIPENSYFVGTANKDDSTFTIADKVYDRAITIDFDNRNIPFTVEEEADTIHLSQSKFKELFDGAKKKVEFKMTEEDFNKLHTVTDYIYEQFDVTFGNRILNQIIEIVPIYCACGGKKEEALDFLVSRKVISKLEGRFEEYVKNALKELLNLIQKTYGANVLVRCEKEIQSLMRRL